MFYRSAIWSIEADQPLSQSYLFDLSVIIATGSFVISLLEGFDVLPVQLQYGIFSDIITLMFILGVISFKKAPFLNAEDELKRKSAHSYFYASSLAAGLGGLFFIGMLFNKFDPDGEFGSMNLAVAGLICVALNISLLYFAHWVWAKPKSLEPREHLSIPFLKTWYRAVHQGNFKAYDGLMGLLVALFALLYVLDQTIQADCQTGVESFALLGFIAYGMGRFFYQAPLLMPQDRGETPSFKIRLAFHGMLVLCGALVIASLAALINPPTSEVLLDVKAGDDASTERGVLPGFALATLTPVLAGGVYAYRQWNPY